MPTFFVAKLSNVTERMDYSAMALVYRKLTKFHPNSSTSKNKISQKLPSYQHIIILFLEKK
jgi:hypothetical protein